MIGGIPEVMVRVRSASCAVGALAVAMVLSCSGASESAAGGGTSHDADYVKDNSLVLIESAQNDGYGSSLGI